MCIQAVLIVLRELLKEEEEKEEKEGRGRGGQTDRQTKKTWEEMEILGFGLSMIKVTAFI